MTNATIAIRLLPITT